MRTEPPDSRTQERESFSAYEYRTVAVIASFIKTQPLMATKLSLQKTQNLKVFLYTIPIADILVHIT